MITPTNGNLKLNRHANGVQTESTELLVDSPPRGPQAEEKKHGAPTNGVKLKERFRASDFRPAAHEIHAAEGRTIAKQEHGGRRRRTRWLKVAAVSGAAILILIPPVHMLLATMGEEGGDLAPVRGRLPATEPSLLPEIGEESMEQRSIASPGLAAESAAAKIPERPAEKKAKPGVEPSDLEGARDLESEAMALALASAGSPSGARGLPSGALSLDAVDRDSPAAEAEAGSGAGGHQRVHRTAVIEAREVKSAKVSAPLPRRIVKSPILSERADPVYPPEAIQKEYQGSVRVRALISASGTVARHEILASEHPGVFDRSIADALARWRFGPALDESNRPIECWKEFVLVFKLEDAGR